MVESATKSRTAPSPQLRVRWHFVLVGCMVALAAALTGAAVSSAESPASHRAVGQHAFRPNVHRRESSGNHNWVTSWAASPQQPTEEYGSPQAEAGLSDVTVRNVVYPSVGGDAIRVRFSNTFGTKPLVIGHASVSTELQAAVPVRGSLRALSFDGKASVTIPPGREVLSDVLNYHVTAERDLMISVFVPEDTGPTTYHDSAEQDNWISQTGDFAMSSSPAPFTTDMTSWYFVDGLVVDAPSSVEGTVVALGDSITDGAFSGLDANLRWPNVAQDRLAARGGKTLSIVDEGIGGNRLLVNSPCWGESAITRFQRDVASQPGVKDVIVLLGTNDLLVPNDPNPGAIAPCEGPHVEPTAAQFIDGLKELATMAHQARIRIFGGTIMPLRGTTVWNPSIEAERDRINQWILSNHVLDGAVDFASSVADPLDPTYLDPRLTSPPQDLHPNDRGYIQMGSAVNLRMLLGGQ